MSAPFPPKRLFLALSIVVALAAGIAARQPKDDPEPPGKGAGETATPAVDLDKAKTDANLARQAAANQARSMNNLKQIGLAVHNYHDTYNRLPDDIRDGKGKALLSWRVLLLPFIEQSNLYKEFRLSEAWDSPHNSMLLARMPNLYSSPRVKLKGKGYTVYQVFRGPNAVFGRANPLRLGAIPDGTSNTILAVESSTAVPWTKPGDIPFDRKKALPAFGKAFGDRPLAVMMDGSARVLDLKKIRAETLKNAIDPADGNVLGKDWLP
jgi:hypothetical protein